MENVQKNPVSFSDLELSFKFHAEILHSGLCNDNLAVDPVNLNVSPPSGEEYDLGQLSCEIQTLPTHSCYNSQLVAIQYPTMCLLAVMAMAMSSTYPMGKLFSSISIRRIPSLAPRVRNPKMLNIRI
ncbi:hypothetical protein J6590_013706 [Homalodisca vitripennis]|nr:hypothetical protein J6590_013706 [Homalodisca vitripennis]